MRKIFLLGTLLSLLAPTLFAQEVEAPDYNYIKQVTRNSKGANYYPVLMRRFVNNDTTMTLEQYRNLYYGYALQEDYIPYKTQNKPLLNARRRFIKAKGDSNMAPEMIRVAEAALADNPFDIPALSIIAASYLQIGDTAQFHVWDIKQNGILDAILSSGDGETPESAFHVIDVAHEYEVLHRMGMTVVADSLVGKDVEYLRVKENAAGEYGFYFNYGKCRELHKKKYE